MKTYFPVAVALLLGAAIGYCFAPVPPEPVLGGKAEVSTNAPPAVDEGDKSSIRALRARVRELEDLLAKKGVEVERMKEEESERAASRERRFDPRENLERLKKEDPARYAQITNGMAQFRMRRLERTQHKMDILGSVDTSRMSDRARQTHEALLDAIERRETLEDRMRDFMDMTDDERRSIMDELRETNGRIRELNAAERDTLLAKTAEMLGFEGEAAEEIVETVKDIYEATETDHAFGPGRPGGRGGRRGGRGGGNGGGER